MTTLNNQSQTYYWVTGDIKKGFKILTKRPRTKFVPEPIQGMQNVQRWISLQYLLNA